MNRFIAGLLAVVLGVLAVRADGINIPAPSWAYAITSLGTGVATALGINVGSAGAVVTNGGALGTPSSGTLTNATGLPTTGLTGTLQAAQEPAHTGDVTNSAGNLTMTLAAGSASNLNSGTLAAARGGAGQVNGALAGNGSGAVSQAASTQLSDVTAATTWTVTDQSGAALTFTSVTGNFSKGNKTCVGTIRFTYPVTADGSTTKISLPCTIVNNGNPAIGSCFSTSGVALNSQLILLGLANTATALFVNTAGSGASPVNSTMSTLSVGCSFSFITT